MTQNTKLKLGILVLFSILCFGFGFAEEQKQFTEQEINQIASSTKLSEEVLRYFELTRLSDFTDTFYFDSYDGKVRVYFANNNFIATNFHKYDPVYGIAVKSNLEGLDYEIAFNMDKIQKSVYNNLSIVSDADIFEIIMVHELSHIVYFQELEKEDWNEKLKADMYMNLKEDLFGEVVFKDYSYFMDYPVGNYYQLNAFENIQVNFQNLLKSYSYPRVQQDDEVFVRIMSVCLKEKGSMQIDLVQNDFCDDFNVSNYQSQFTSLYENVLKGYVLQQKTSGELEQQNRVFTDVSIFGFDLRVPRLDAEWFRPVVAIFELFLVGVLIFKLCYRRKCV